MHVASMRQETFTLGLTPDRFVPKDHPLRRIEPLVDSPVAAASPLCDQLYAVGGRQLMRGEHLFRSSVVMAFCRIHPLRHLCQQLC